MTRFSFVDFVSTTVTTISVKIHRAADMICESASHSADEMRMLLTLPSRKNYMQKAFFTSPQSQLYRSYKSTRGLTFCDSIDALKKYDAAGVMYTQFFPLLEVFVFSSEINEII